MTNNVELQEALLHAAHKACDYRIELENSEDAKYHLKAITKLNQLITYLERQKRQVNNQWCK